jgi:hypothetical protein
MTQTINRHWCEGGTALTNFAEDMRPVYTEAVKRYGDPTFIVEAQSTPAAPYNYGGSLHWLGAGPNANASAFWAVFDQVKQEQNK